MTILRVQHAVPSFDAWKRAFDGDPIGRKACGVRSHQVHRAVADPTFVAVDLHFDTPAEAESFLAKLRHLWNGPGKAVMRSPEAWIFETIESVA